MFPYSCPFCSQRLLALPDRVGQRTICPKCLRPLTIPRPEQAGDAPGEFPDIDHDAPPPPPGSGLTGNTPNREATEQTLGGPPRPTPFDADHILGLDGDPVESLISGPPSGGNLGGDSTGSEPVFTDLDGTDGGAIFADPLLTQWPAAAAEASVVATGEFLTPRPDSPERNSYDEDEIDLSLAHEQATNDLSLAHDQATNDRHLEPPIELTPAPLGYPPPRVPAASVSAAANGSARLPAYAPGGPTTPRPVAPPLPMRYAPAPATPSHAAAAFGVSTPPGPSRLPRHETGTVSFAPPGVSSVDVSAELTAALTMRMPPPPEPAADLALTTGGWLLACGAVAVLWLAGVLTTPSLLPYVALLGVLMIAFGFLWGAYLVGRTRPVRGVLTLLPPVALVRIWLPYGDNGYRPLRFVLTGALALALYFVGGPAREAVTAGLAEFDYERATAAPPPPIADRLTAAVAAGDPDAALTDLDNLTTPAYRNEIPPAEQPAIVAALKAAAAGRVRPDVRAKAVAVLLEWSEADGRVALMQLLASPTSTERRGGMALAPRWADAAVARAVAQRLDDRMEGSQAREALARMDPRLAEDALLPHLRAAAGDPVALLTIAEMLERFGGAKSVLVLEEMAASNSRDKVRVELKRIAATIRKREITD